ncbi:MAG: DUF4115 domain-containing protein [Prochlorococcaceae cyanobacterium MAG_34]|nr:DUF4115 domain-containing protein [Prochlorococcaceae cyanobacterium MAG_34]
MEAQVAEAQAELEEYQRLLNELPGIYEGKFRQKLRSVAQEIRQLLDERKALQQQVVRALAETRQPQLLPASGAVSEFSDHPKAKIWIKLQIHRFRRLPKPRLIGISAAAVLVLVVAALGIPSLFSSRALAPRGGALIRSSQAPSVLNASTTIQLQALGGESWVLVEDLKGRQVFDAILQPGAPKRFPLAQGLRLRSGRPDLLFVAVGDAVPKPLGDVGDLDWVEIRP